MLWYEFIFLFFANVLLLIDILLILKPVFKSPIIEIKLFFIGMIISAISFCLYMIVALYSNAYQNIPPYAETFDKAGYFFSMIGLLFLGFAFILPNFRSSYSNVLFITIFSILGSSAAFVNGMTSKISINGEFIKSTHNPFGLLLNYLFIAINLYVIFRRVYEVSKISQLSKNRTKSVNSLKILLVLFTVSFLVSVLTNIISPKQILPNYFYFLFVSIAFAFFIYFYLKDKGFFFLTPISLDALIIMHKESGMTIYSESYKENFRVEDMLSNIFTLLNISLQEFILAKKDLVEIIFADKTVIIAPGKQISSILIANGKNLIIETLTKALTTNFEKKFTKEIIEGSEKNYFDRMKFLSFLEFTSEVRRYLPL